jgi:hypothetical protein
MEVKGLDVNPGKWLVADCGKVPSESNCQMVLMAPAEQKDHLAEASVDHMVKHHGHTEEEARKVLEEQPDVFEEVSMEAARV